MVNDAWKKTDRNKDEVGCKCVCARTHVCTV